MANFITSGGNTSPAGDWTQPVFRVGPYSQFNNGAISTTITMNDYFGSGATVGWYSQSTFSVNYIIDELQKLRTEAEEFCKDSPYFNLFLQGYSGLLSRQIFRRFKDYCHVALAYSNHKHIFCIIKETKTSDIEYIADLTANRFNEAPITLIEKKLVDLTAKPWWNIEQLYTSEASLIKRQRKDGWAEHEITLTEAKKKKTPKFKFVTNEATDLENGKIKILPFDDASFKFLKERAKHKGFGTNIAQLILDCPVKDLKNLIAVVENYL